METLRDEQETPRKDRRDFGRGVRHRAPSAVRLAEEGAQIVIADRAKADDTLVRIKAAGGSATAVQCDISDPASVAKLKAEVENSGERCDILINNAGIYPMQSFDEITFEDWRRVLSVNLDLMFLMAKAFAGGMRQRGWGRIINLASDTVKFRSSPTSCITSPAKPAWLASRARLRPSSVHKA